MNEILTSPRDLVAKALGVPSDQIKDTDSMGQHPLWDSVAHLNVIVEIESAYNIQVPDKDVLKYDNVPAIIQLWEQKTGRKAKQSNGLKEWFKQTLVGKIFFKKT